MKDKHRGYMLFYLSFGRAHCNAQRGMNIRAKWGARRRTSLTIGAAGGGIATRYVKKRRRFCEAIPRSTPYPLVVNVFYRPPTQRVFRALRCDFPSHSIPHFNFVRRSDRFE